MNVGQTVPLNATGQTPAGKTPEPITFYFGGRRSTGD